MGTEPALQSPLSSNILSAVLIEPDGIHNRLRFSSRLAVRHRLDPDLDAGSASGATVVVAAAGFTSGAAVVVAAAVVAAGLS